MTLHDRMKNNGFGFTFFDFPSFACKIWALENDWEALLICNPDHRNAKQVFNAMIVLRKTQSKKMMCNLNKQNLYVSYIWTLKLEYKARKEKLRIEWKECYYPLIEDTKSLQINDFDEESKSISLHIDKL